MNASFRLDAARTPEFESYCRSRAELSAAPMNLVPTEAAHFLAGLAIAVGDIGREATAGVNSVVVSGSHWETTGVLHKGQMFVFHDLGTFAYGQDAYKDPRHPWEPDFQKFGDGLAIGDFNLDGIGDLAVGASTPDEDLLLGQSAPSRVWVFLGGPSFPSARWYVEYDGTLTDDENLFGRALAFGDVTGSAHLDLVVGDAWRNSAPPVVTHRGIVEMFVGADAGSSPFAESSKITLNDPAPQGQSNFGYAVSVGVRDAFGRKDAVVGAPGHRQVTTDNAGKVVIYRF